MARSDDLLVRVLKADGVAERLPEGLRDEAYKWLSENEARLEEERRLAEEAEKEAEKERTRRESELESALDELLCRGTAWSNVMRKFRFALCRRSVDGAYCAVDLARGYMSPYWGYWGGDLCATKFYTSQISPVLTAVCDEELARLIEHDWNFFEVAEHEKFSVVDYTVVDGKVHVNGLGPEMTLKEHQRAMEEKYGLGGEALQSEPACKN